MESILENISDIIDQIVCREERFGRIDKVKLLGAISEILGNFTPEQLKISREDLFERIRKIIMFESVFGILNELSPQEMRDFDQIVGRRPLFK